MDGGVTVRGGKGNGLVLVGGLDRGGKGNGFVFVRGGTGLGLGVGTVATGVRPPGGTPNPSPTKGNASCFGLLWLICPTSIRVAGLINNVKVSGSSCRTLVQIIGLPTCRWGKETPSAKEAEKNVIP